MLLRQNYFGSSDVLITEVNTVEPQDLNEETGMPWLGADGPAR